MLSVRAVLTLGLPSNRKTVKVNYAIASRGCLQFFPLFPRSSRCNYVTAKEKRFVSTLPQLSWKKAKTFLLCKKSIQNASRGFFRFCSLCIVEKVKKYFQASYVPKTKQKADTIAKSWTLWSRKTRVGNEFSFTSRLKFGDFGWEFTWNRRSNFYARGRIHNEKQFSMKSKLIDHNFYVNSPRQKWIAIWSIFN